MAASTRHTRQVVYNNYVRNISIFITRGGCNLSGINLDLQSAGEWNGGKDKDGVGRERKRPREEKRYRKGARNDEMREKERVCRELVVERF